MLPFYIIPMPGWLFNLLSRNGVYTSCQKKNSMCPSACPFPALLVPIAVRFAIYTWIFVCHAGKFMLSNAAAMEGCLLSLSLQCYVHARCAASSVQERQRLQHTDRFAENRYNGKTRGRRLVTCTPGSAWICSLRRVHTPKPLTQHFRWGDEEEAFGCSRTRYGEVDITGQQASFNNGPL